MVGSSPWLIAATHVLHRLQAPRHPPLALCSLEIFKKMLVLAMEFSRGTAARGRRSLTAEQEQLGSALERLWDPSSELSGFYQTDGNLAE